MSRVFCLELGHGIIGHVFRVEAGNTFQGSWSPRKGVRIEKLTMDLPVGKWISRRWRLAASSPSQSCRRGVLIKRTIYQYLFRVDAYQYLKHQRMA